MPPSRYPVSNIAPNVLGCVMHMTSSVLHWFFIVFFCVSQFAAFLAARTRFFQKSRTAPSRSVSSLSDVGPDQRREIPAAVTTTQPKEDMLAQAIKLASSTDDTSIQDLEGLPEAPRLRDVPQLTPQAKVEKERIHSEEYREREQQREPDLTIISKDLVSLISFAGMRSKS